MTGEGTHRVQQPKKNINKNNQLTSFFDFHPETWGRFPIWQAYFSNGLKLNHQPDYQTLISLVFWADPESFRVSA